MITIKPTGPITIKDGKMEIPYDYGDIKATTIANDRVLKKLQADKTRLTERLSRIDARIAELSDAVTKMTTAQKDIEKAHPELVAEPEPIEGLIK